MKSFRIVPTIRMYETFREFEEQTQLTQEDLIITSDFIIKNFLPTTFATLIDLYQYGQGEPTDLLVEKITDAIGEKTFQRVIGIGGGTVLDVTKLFALSSIRQLDRLFDGREKPVKDKELILVPTTCGTGSEMTNISILELTKKKTKKGLADDALFANEAALIPELLESLPYHPFATSSLDALIHSIESYLSPHASTLSRFYSLKGLSLILEGYMKIIHDHDARYVYLSDFLMGSTCAGIAFLNAGCGAVHAMSYPLGATYHVPHGEANYALLMGVLKYYEKVDNQRFSLLLDELARVLSCNPNNALKTLSELLIHILPLKPLKDYGVTAKDLSQFSRSVIENQQRLLKNALFPLEEKDIMTIYQSLY